MNKSAILVLNCGSSSIKFSVITTQDTQEIISGLAERLNSDQANITFKQNERKSKLDKPNANHQYALIQIINTINDLDDVEIFAVGHRVVHGGEMFSASCLIDQKVIDGITACSDLAPLHNPANIEGIVAVQKAFPNLPQVAVFDTAFHQSLSEENYLYATPYEWYEKYGVRRYGFHGTSFRYISQFVTSHLGYQKIIVAHLGNGASVCAINKGQSVANSMGLTPLDGLAQGTRSGFIDPAIIDFMVQKTQKTAAQITDDLWKKSGFLGVSQLSNDCRELETQAQKGNKNAKRALTVFVNRLQQIIGGYVALLEGVDAIIFTGGIGENSSEIRKKTMGNFGFLNSELDERLNSNCIRGKQGNIAKKAKLPVWVIPTNEERMIAIDTIECTQL